MADMIPDVCPFGRHPCNLLHRELTPSEKMWLGREIVSGEQTTVELHAEYQLPFKNLYRYRDKYVNGDNFYNRKGRPAILGGVQKAKLIECLTTSDYQMRSEDHKAKFQELAEEHAEERHKAKSQVKRISRRTLARYEDELNIKTGNAEVTTNTKLPRQ